MEIGEITWPKLQALAAVQDREAPKAVVVALSSILGDVADGALSWSLMSTTETTTTWTCWIVTEHSVGHVRIEYTAAIYDQSAEAQRELTPSAWSAWVRPLADIVEFRYGAFYAAPGKSTVFEPAVPLTLIFANGDQCKIPGPIPLDQRGAADNLFTRIRAGVKF
ncbi:MAG: hypothetical protein WA622_00045 [Mycobacterium sp.]|uniref:hypothetical protein n=1 Tax=Mycobacterium sp. TaxID=1785 RepID=UPI003BB63979